MFSIFQSKECNISRNEYILADGKKIYYLVQDDSVFVISRLTLFSDFYDRDFFSYCFKNLKRKKIIFTHCRQKENDLPKFTVCKKNPIDTNLRIDLPYKDTEEFISSLGKKTRMHLRQYQRGFERKFNGGGYKSIVQSFEQGFPAVDKSNFEYVVKLNHERCLSKGFESGVDGEKYWNSYKKYAVLNLLTAEGMIVAGTISTVFNGELCLHVIAHDNDYGSYNVGNLILLQTIDYAIKSGIKTFNMLWGRCDYKLRFNAVEETLYDYFVCKNLFVFTSEQIKFFFKETKIFLPKAFSFAKRKILGGIKFMLKKLHLFNFVKRMMKRSEKAV